jgi:hypothetical protein
MLCYFRMSHYTFSALILFSFCSSFSLVHDNRKKSQACMLGRERMKKVKDLIIFQWRLWQRWWQSDECNNFLQHPSLDLNNRNIAKVQFVTKEKVINSRPSSSTLLLCHFIYRFIYFRNSKRKEKNAIILLHPLCHFDCNFSFASFVFIIH